MLNPTDGGSDQPSDQSYPYVITEDYRRYLMALGIDGEVPFWRCELGLLSDELSTVLTRSSRTKRCLIGAEVRSDRCSCKIEPWYEMGELMFLPSDLRVVAPDASVLASFGRAVDELHLLISGQLISGDQVLMNSMLPESADDDAADCGIAWIEADPPQTAPRVRLYHTREPRLDVLDRMPSVMQIVPASPPAVAYELTGERPINP